ncbi:hypothetical protein LPJ61_003944 [Coemansia biformis]|uniref:Uncharacterized protein n=1 Tax=Coemansia biformis TaxID=1286918 RepID=A0A9W8CY51_9FUNG|nr:hypothetical protein LPJ61_003944 [Coemansia biformis]
MAVSASNSPYFEGSGPFEGLGEQPARGLSFPLQRSASLVNGVGTASSRRGRDVASGDAADAGGDGDGGDDTSGANDDGGTLNERRGPPLQPQHNFPPLAVDDINGNTMVVPSNLLNNSGQPIYSSTAHDTMCRIHYPHGKASLHDLSRRAKQLLEWLGKTQVEYEHERQTWDPETQDVPAVASPAAMSPVNATDSQRGARVRRLSDAPTSPIGPNDWPDDADDGAGDGAGDSVESGAAGDGSGSAQPKPPRPTLSIMEDLMWRLIQFQEAYSN